LIGKVMCGPAAGKLMKKATIVMIAAFVLWLLDNL